MTGLPLPGRDRFPKARQVLCESFERCFDKLNITSGDYVAVVTRGHRYDMDCLRALLSGKEPAYMGMMGLQAAGIGDQESSVVGRLRGKGR